MAVDTPRSSRIAGAILGGEIGAALGLLLLGGALLLPLVTTAAGALVGPVVAGLAGRARRALAAHWIRAQIRGAGQATAGRPLRRRGA